MSHYIWSYAQRVVAQTGCSMFLGALLYSGYFPAYTEQVGRMIKTIEFDVGPTEDLMREHGALNRILLIYEEIIRKIDEDNSAWLSALRESIEIVESFIENYHEKLEEEYIFPLFQKAQREIRLIRTLKKQHDKGREITALVKKMLGERAALREKEKKVVKNLLKKFITMYRPHEAREDTVVFPKVRQLISEDKFKELGELFEKKERDLFGQDGFEMMVQKIEKIEKELGIYNLEQFTPQIGL
jgi:hemerythrin-like domain-containing protein